MLLMVVREFLGIWQNVKLYFPLEIFCCAPKRVGLRVVSVHVGAVSQEPVHFPSPRQYCCAFLVEDGPIDFQDAEYVDAA